MINTESQRGKVTCPRSHSLGPNLGNTTSRTGFAKHQPLILQPFQLTFPTSSASMSASLLPEASLGGFHRAWVWTQCSPPDSLHLNYMLDPICFFPSPLAWTGAVASRGFASGGLIVSPLLPFSSLTSQNGLLRTQVPPSGSLLWPSRDSCLGVSSLTWKPAVMNLIQCLLYARHSVRHYGNSKPDTELRRPPPLSPPSLTPSHPFPGAQWALALASFPSRRQADP